MVRSGKLDYMIKVKGVEQLENEILEALSHLGFITFLGDGRFRRNTYKKKGA